MFAYTAFFLFLNQNVKLRASDQPQSVGEGSISTRDITQLCVISLSQSEAINVFPKHSEIKST